MRTKGCFSRQRRLWAVIAVLIVAGIPCRAQEPEFLKHATRVVDVPPLQSHYITQYWWLSPTQLLVNGRLEHADNWGMLFRYDTVAKQSTRLDALTNLFTDLKEPAVFRYDTIRVSPNGQWILWTDQHTGEVFGSQLDGSGAFECIPRLSKSTGSLTTMCWTNDSRHWVAFHYDFGDELGRTTAISYDVNRTDKPMEYPTTGSNGRADAWLGEPSSQSFVADNRLLVATWMGSNHNMADVTVQEIGINRPATALQSRRIHLPEPVIREMRIAPSGRRVAWILADLIQPHLSSMSSTYLYLKSYGLSDMPKKGTLGHYMLFERPITVSLWVSDVDGTHLHRIGSIIDTHRTGRVPYSLQWVPGEKRLSFIYNDALWTLPVD